MKSVKILTAIVPAFLAVLALSFSARASNTYDDLFWNEHLRQTHFGEVPIAESDDVIQLHMPAQAEDPTIVPVNIYAMLPQAPDRYIKAITLIIDNNPVPVVGRFMFTVGSGRADVSLRVRINELTPVRAIAELSDGTLHMSRQIINASGGCSAPMAGDLEVALSRLGKMKLSVGAMSPDDKPLASTLRIRHPNITGMQTVGGKPTPAHYVKQVKVRYNDEVVFSAETDISVSADPSFGFYFVPQEGGEMIAEVTDSAGKTFTREIDVQGRPPLR